MKEIKLTQGKTAFVDDEDFDELNQYKWQYHSNGYAVRAVWHHKKMMMHRQIMNNPTGMDIDHINGNKLDNRRMNLRVCTHSENLRNRNGSFYRKSLLEQNRIN